MVRPIPEFSHDGRIVRFLLRLVAFTIAVCLAVAVSIAVLAFTLTIADGAIDDTLASLSALVVFAAVIAVPTYLLVTRCDREP